MRYDYWTVFIVYADIFASPVGLSPKASTLTAGYMNDYLLGRRSDLLDHSDDLGWCVGLHCHLNWSHYTHAVPRLIVKYSGSLSVADPDRFGVLFQPDVVFLGGWFSV